MECPCRFDHPSPGPHRVLGRRRAVQRTGRKYSARPPQMLILCGVRGYSSSSSKDRAMLKGKNMFSGWIHSSLFLARSFHRSRPPKNRPELSAATSADDAAATEEIDVWRRRRRRRNSRPLHARAINGSSKSKAVASSSLSSFSKL